MAKSTLQQHIKTFYTESPGLTICINSGELMPMEGGLMGRRGRKEVSFSELGGCGIKRPHPNGEGYDLIKFGILTTSDPEVIEFLDQRAEEVGDVFGPDKFQDLVMDAQKAVKDMKVVLADRDAEIRRLQEQLEQANERAMTSENRLAQMLSGKKEASSQK